MCVCVCVRRLVYTCIFFKKSEFLFLLPKLDRDVLRVFSPFPRHFLKTKILSPQIYIFFTQNYLCTHNNFLYILKVMQLMYAVIIDMMCVVKVSSSCFVQIFKEKTYHSKYIYTYIYEYIYISL